MGGVEGPGVLACTLPSDCGTGFSCCTSMTVGPSVTHCSKTCDPANSMQVCKTNEDCRRISKYLCGDQTECVPLVRCAPLEADPHYPAWLKTCRVMEP
jgi:hypothetical protein